MEIGHEVVEVAVRELRIRGHARVAEALRIADELLELQRISILDDRAQLKAFIRDPQSFRYTRMPANPQLSDRDLDDLVAYFEAMRERKQAPEEQG